MYFIFITIHIVSSMEYDIIVFYYRVIGEKFNHFDIISPGKQ